MILVQEKKNKTICIVQISRIGDVIQTLRSIKYYKEKYPKSILIYVGRAQFSEKLLFLIDQYFDKYFFFNFNKDILSNSGIGLKEAHKYIHDFILDINQYEIDLCINLTFSDSSSFLTSLIEAKEKTGLSRDMKGELQILGLWSQYVYATIMEGPFNPFNLIDIYNSILGTKLDEIVEDPSSAKIKKIFIHPFTSHHKKKFETSKWIEIIYQTIKYFDDYQIYLLGSIEDIQDGKILFQSNLLNRYKNRIFNFIGVKDIAEIYQEMKDASLFVGHDSMIGHLASFLNVQTLTISLGTVRPHDTSPYGGQNFNILPKIKCFPCFPDEECGHLSCQKNISHQVVIEIIKLIICDKDITVAKVVKNISPINLSLVEIYQTYFSKTNKLNLTPILNEYQDSTLELFRNFYQILWNYMLSEQEENLPIPQIKEEVGLNLKDYLSGIEQLNDLCGFGEKYSNDIINESLEETPDIRQISSIGRKIEEVDGLSFILKKRYPLLSPIINFFYIGRSNLKGSSLSQMATNSILNFREENLALNVLVELISKVMERNSNEIGHSPLNTEDKNY